MLPINGSTIAALKTNEEPFSNTYDWPAFKIGYLYQVE
jgi:hypothetical protein